MADEWDPQDPPTFDAANASDEDGDEYDPTSIDFDADAEYAARSQTASANISQAPSRVVSTAPNAAEQPAKPKTKGGFIVEESSDEEDENVQDSTPAPSQLNGANGAHSGLGAAAMSEAKDDNLGSVPTTDTAAAVSHTLNGSTAAPTSISATVPSVVSHTPVPSIPIQPAPADQGGAPVLSAQNSIAPTPQPPVNGAAPASTNDAVPPTPTTARLPHDIVGQLEDRIKDDPKGDHDAWRNLIAHYREKEQPDKVRSAYERFFTFFPTASGLWIEYLNFEQDNNDIQRLETILSKSLPHNLNVDLWHWYVNFLRRRHPLINDSNGANRSIIYQAFEVVLNHVGMDPDSGAVWRDYIEFVKSGPGNLGGTGWQDTQKADLVRKAYHQAIALPHDELVRLWQEYDKFEVSLNKAAGRKNLHERSRDYMAAKTAYRVLSDRIVSLDRTSLPKPPPLFGCEGDMDFDFQVRKWKDWIAWEKSDPLEFGADDIASLNKRILFVYKQATMALRFYPLIWYEASAWCFANNQTTEGDNFLDQGIASNPESVLLTLQKADIVEKGLVINDNDELAAANGEKLEFIYENAHKALYAMRDVYAKREAAAVAQITEHFASLPAEDDDEQYKVEDDDDEASNADKPKSRNEQKEEQIKSAKAAIEAQRDVLKRTISYLWVAKMRAFRRVQGQGSGRATDPKKGFRGTFSLARPRGMLTSDVYACAALMEWNCYKADAATKIFDRGVRLFPTDEIFALEYIKHLITIDDFTNAKVMFEQTLSKIMNSATIPEDQKREKCKPLLLYMHSHESDYGDLAQIHKLEQRLKDMFPEEPDILRFSYRFELPSFDAFHAQLVVSSSQTRQKSAREVAAEAAHQHAPVNNNARSPPRTHLALGPHGPYVATSSPKRPLDDSDDGTPRKYMRAESPIKGAAGRRIATTGTGVLVTNPAGSNNSTKTYFPGGIQQPSMAPTPLPRDVSYLLSILPNAASYNATRFDPGKMVDFLRNVNLFRP